VANQSEDARCSVLLWARATIRALPWQRSQSAASFHSGNFGGERASIRDRQSTIGATFRDTLKDPKKAVESHVQENWGEFKVEVAGHIAVIHLKVERLIFFVVPHSHTFGLSAAMRA
jgi:hypothetical protein